MNILLATRLYSGFETSLEKKIWEPEGVPTIYNLINHLDNTYNLSIVFTSKDSGPTYSSKWKKKNDLNINLIGLKANIKVLAGIYYFPNFFSKKFSMILRDLRQSLCLIIQIFLKKPDLIYFDAANISIAYLTSILFPKKIIILRVLGVDPYLWSILKSKRLISRIYKFLFKGNFSAVIGTQDGSGTEFWLDKILNKKVPKYVLLNGVDSIINNNSTTNKELKIKKNNQKKIVILFVGRLEEYKGIRIFVQAVINTIQISNKNIQAIIVGNGSLYEDMLDLIKSNACSENFIFMKNIPHTKVLHFHTISDIYVSTNKDGNLSNANLEAINSNDCMIIPLPRKNEFIDIETESLIGNSVVYFNINDNNDLTNKILYLVNNPNIINNMKNKILKIKITFIKTWDERIEEELNILMEIYKKSLVRVNKY